ncbi:MAG: GMC family oxidoreductase [Chroococcidiopsidaceae cyanobacterium CP_BM_ER_R8_30]|nr:GMC family oxidoreductase [Chroococcidiopsidaceae cyanobacterium CP_BM_ER_R8_30]
MMKSTEHYDFIIVGTGAGGGTLAYRLAPTGKKILVLERGDFLPREKANWDALEVYQKERYYTQEHWYDKNDEAFRPQTGYWVGGNTKLYGAALTRLRERDFERVIHKGGISPAWDLKYSDFEPYYTQAEHLYDVHGERGKDPTEPPYSAPYPHPPVSHEKDMQEIADGIREIGYYPFHLPLAMRLNETDRTKSPCIRCNTFDGYPCLVQAKGDAEVNAMRPALDAYPNLTLLTNAKALKLHTSASGKEVTAVEVDVNGELHHFSADIVAIACGAVNSAALLLRSANDKHPNGLGNSSDQVGRNYMKQQLIALLALGLEPNQATFQKTIAVNDFYWGEPDFPYPMGMVQNTGNVLSHMIPAEAPSMIAPYLKLVPGFELHLVAERSVGWWLQTEDLPDPNNRVRVIGDKVYLDYTPNNTEAAERLVHRWTSVLKSLRRKSMHVIPFGIYPRARKHLAEVAHQCGGCRFGRDPQTSVLDLNCRTHDVDNLYVVDSSFFPSNSGVNPTLTIMANALRVGEHLAKRWQ